MITLVLSNPGCLEEALACAATGLVFGQQLQLIVLAQPPAQLPEGSQELAASLAQIGLPVHLEQSIDCPGWLAALAPSSSSHAELARLLATSTHCLAY